MSKTIAIDLDDTILDFDMNGWLEDGLDYFGEPKKDARESLMWLRKHGHKIIIHTARINNVVHLGYTINQMHQYVFSILHKYRLPYDSIWTGRGKPLADYYWDDRARMFTTWKNMISELRGKP